MTIIESYADFVAGIGEQQIPESALAGARRSILDWYGATIAGGDQPPATMLCSVTGDSTGSARLIPSGVPCGARDAALINGTAAHTMEVDDIYRDGLYHPGAPVIAAAMAVAEDRGAGGSDLVRAVIAGYEVSNRIAVAINPAHYRYWHTTATVGFFGAAAAAASVLRLDASGVGHAMATAGTFAAGLQQAFRSDAMSKPLHAGRAAEGGVLAALAAEAGVTGALDILEGPAGFAAAMSDDRERDWSADDLGARYSIAAMSQKAHACCGHTFAAIDAMLELRDAHELEADDIEHVEVRTYNAALEICGNTDPKTAFEARFSLPYCVAAGLLWGPIVPVTFADEALADSRLRQLMAKVSPVLDAELDAAFPARRSATLVVTTRDGRMLDRHRPTRKGDPDDPLTDAELGAKFRGLAAGLGSSRAEALENALWRIDSLERIADLPLGPEGPRAAHA